MSAPTIVLLALYIALSLLDVISTERVIRRGGHEANPPMAWLMLKLGRDGAYAIKLLAALAIGTAAAILAPIALVLLCALGCWVVWHNWRIVKR